MFQWSGVGRWMGVAAVVGGLAAGGAAYGASTDSGPVIHACYGTDGSLRLSPDGVCKRSETPLDWNQTGLQGPPGPTGPSGATGPAGPPGQTGATGPAGSAHQVFSGSVNAGGAPQESGFTVQHTAGSGLYRMDFPAGTFTGNAGNFVIASVTPISNTYVNFASSIAPIAADGSASFEVQFANGETLFDFVVAVATH